MHCPLSHRRRFITADATTAAGLVAVIGAVPEGRLML